MLPWAIRNQRAIGHFTFLSTLGGVGLYIGNNPQADGNWHRWQEGLERARPGTLARGELAVDETARKEAVRWIREHPRQAALLYLKKLSIIFDEDQTVAWWAIYGKGIGPPGHRIDAVSGPSPLDEHPSAVLGTLRFAARLLLALAIGGFAVLFYRASRARTRFQLALAAGYLVAVTYVPLLSAPIAVNGRYRWPSEDLCIPIAAMFVSSWRDYRGQRSGTNRSAMAIGLPSDPRPDPRHRHSEFHSVLN